MRSIRIALFLVGILFPIQASTYIWIEAESSRQHNFPARSWLKPANALERSALSGGAWLSSSGRSGKRRYAQYSIMVKQSGEYHFWMRKFWKHGPFRWQFNNGKINSCGWSVPLYDNYPIRRHVSANWIHLGRVRLKKGRQLLKITLKHNRGPAAFDCFVLSRKPFFPRGPLKPGKRFQRAPSGWFPFEPELDKFTKSPIDLSFLNAKPAGKFGRISRRGKDFVYSRIGRKVRFWGVTLSDDTLQLNKASIRYLARRLAKAGVNLVRIHLTPYYSQKRYPTMDTIHFLFSQLKKHGIYSGINWYGLAVPRVQSFWKLKGFKPGDRPFALHLYYPPMQRLYRKWGEGVLTGKNPYTGISLAEDPALLFVELVNEDNYFFYTFNPARINPVALPVLERTFGNWLIKKYGSLPKVLRQWGNSRKPTFSKDRINEKRIALYRSAHLGSKAWQKWKRNPRRATDQLRFMTENTRLFYSGIRQWLKTTCGYRGLVLTGNWQTADNSSLGPLDMYTNLVGDITARNTYFNRGFRYGRKQAFPFSRGDYFVNGSVLANPYSAITMHVQHIAQPHIISEGGWSMPNRFRTEEQLVMACYGSLQGIDGLCPFTIKPDWHQTMQKWPIQTPATFGQYPAAAMIYRMGYVREGPIVAHEKLNLKNLYNSVASRIHQAFAVDTTRKNEVQGSNSSKAKVDPFLFYAGRVVQSIGNIPPDLFVNPKASRLVDRKSKTIRSATGELVLDYKKRLLQINSSRAQGATGFFTRAGLVRCSNIILRMQNEYGAVVLVSLDGNPISRSRRMLLQVMSEEKNFAWKTGTVRTRWPKQSPFPWRKILRVGGGPIVVKDIQGTIQFRNMRSSKIRITPLDYNGYPKGKTFSGNSFQLLPRVLHYYITVR